MPDHADTVRERLVAAVVERLHADPHEIGAMDEKYLAELAVDAVLTVLRIDGTEGA